MIIQYPFNSQQVCLPSNLTTKMSEKYNTIGAPMTQLPRPAASANFPRVQSSLSASHSGASTPFHDCFHNSSLTNLRDMKDLGGSIIKTGASTVLQICTMGKEDLSHTKDHKFSQGATLSCPFLQCGFKNSQFNFPGRFPSEFLLNHLHSNHKHRRYNGDNLDLTMIVPQVEVIGDHQKRLSQGSLSNGNAQSTASSTTQTWPFIEIYSHKRYFYLEAQSYNMDGYHPELFLWLWFLGNEAEELHYRYQLNVVHGKSEYSYKGPVTSMMKAAHEIRNEGRCLVIRERVWDYMSYRLKITKH